MNDQKYTRSNDIVLAEHMVEEESRLTTIELQLDNLKTEIKDLKDSIKDLVDAWKTAGNVVNFVKWLSGGIAALVAIVAAFKMGILK
jgi:hypothetical protein